MAALRAEFDTDRRLVGMIKLIDRSGVTVSFYSALGKAAFDEAAKHGNPKASPLLPYGDTPLGKYVISGVVKTGPSSAYPDVKRFGTAGVIKLVPQSGEALLAQQNGRTGLLIHGGSTSGANLLRRTNGCIRMLDADLLMLLTDMIRLKISGDITTLLEVVEVSGLGGARSDENKTAEEGDPPPL